MKKIILLLIIISSLYACQKDDINDLGEVIYVRRNGADMPAYIYGNGASKVFVVILHGGPGGSGLEYRDGVYSAQLEEKYAMVYWDQRGQGMSQGHYSKDVVNLSEMADDVNALALVLKKKYGDDISLFLMGHSWGGMLGPAALTKDNIQSHFKGWIDVDGAHNIRDMFLYIVRDAIRVSNEQLALGNNTKFWNKFIDYAKGIDTTSMPLSQSESGKLNDYGQKAESVLIDDGIIASGNGTGSLQGLANIFGLNPITKTITGTFTSVHLFTGEEDLSNVDLTPYLHKIKIPSLIIWGKYDLVVPIELAKTAYLNLGSVCKDTVFFARSGHSPMVNEPDKFVEVVSKFIDHHK
jgi:pimeloyl-ACP methyl ester carboxylesterase